MPLPPTLWGTIHLSYMENGSPSASRPIRRVARMDPGIRRQAEHGCVPWRGGAPFPFSSLRVWGGSASSFPKSHKDSLPLHS